MSSFKEKFPAMSEDERKDFETALKRSNHLGHEFGVEQIKLRDISPEEGIVTDPTAYQIENFKNGKLKKYQISGSSWIHNFEKDLQYGYYD